MTSLPPPDAEASRHSRILVERIVGEIGRAGGWIPFARYMELALYAPGLGYYTAGAHKLGRGGDFVTAPELTPLFGQTLAAQAAQVLELAGGHILELGAGSGRLACDVLLELERLGRLPDDYAILEVSPDLRQRQRERLASDAPHLLDRVRWLDALPERFSGLILANEVLDALPAHLLHWRDGTVQERGVGWNGEGFLWADRPLAEGELLAWARRLPVAGDYLSEVCPLAPALVRSLAAMLETGVALFLDYGFPRAEYYHPDRREGTLMCHYRHHAFTDPFVLPGLADITAHVDFTAVADAALDAGLKVLGYTTQAHFLLNCGLLERLGREEVGSVSYLKQAAKVQMLLQPTEMGEFFKVMAVGRGMGEALLGFHRGDRRHVL